MDSESAGISKEVEKTVGSSLNPEHLHLAKMSRLFLAANAALVLRKLETI